MTAFLSERNIDSRSPCVIGPVTSWSSSSFGTFSSGAFAAALAAFRLLGILTPCRHGMPHTQKFGHPRHDRRYAICPALELSLTDLSPSPALRSSVTTRSRESGRIASHRSLSVGQRSSTTASVGGSPYLAARSSAASETRSPADLANSFASPL